MRNLNIISIVFVLKLILLARTLAIPSTLNIFEHHLEGKAEHFQSKSLISPILDTPESFRLPNNTIPLEYEISIGTSIHQGLFNFSGHVQIHVKVIQPTSQITLHSRRLTISRINLYTVENVVILQNAIFEYIDSHDFLIIDLQSSFEKDTELKIEIIFEGELGGDSAGFFYGSYQNQQGEYVYYAATQFQAIYARAAFPCYDEPGIRAVMKVTIVHGKSHFALSNMPVQDISDIGNFLVTRFQPTPPIQTYTLAFTVCDFEFVDAIGNETVHQRIFAIPASIRNNEADFAAEIVKPILTKFEKILVPEYQLPKLDHVAIAALGMGAMENYGLINYHPFLLLVDPRLSKNAKFNYENQIISVICHEVAHQWFGNLISPSWWTYIWLNEGLASLFENLVADLVFPERNFNTRFTTITLPTAFSADGPGSRPMNYYVEDPRMIWDNFGIISYHKAASILRMFMDAITEKIFLLGLDLYLKTNMFKAVTPKELHWALDFANRFENPQSDVSIGDAMETWENQAGYPLVTVTFENDTIRFTQRRYPVSFGEIYSIPITVATNSNPNFVTNTENSIKFWLHTESEVKNFSFLYYSPDDWMILNIQQFGYYRVDYDTNIWHANIRQLFINHLVIHPINRAVLQDEIFIAWLELKRVTAYDCLNMLSYLGMETEHIVWSKTQMMMNIFNDRLFGTYAHDDFLLFLKTLTQAQLFRIGYEDHDDDDYDISQLRSIISPWNCHALDRNCLIIDYQRFQNYIYTNGTINFSFCNAYRLIDDITFEELLNRTADDENAQDRTFILSYMGCTLSSHNLDKLLDVIADGTRNLNAYMRETMLHNTFKGSGIGLAKSLKLLGEKYTELAGLLPYFYDIVMNLSHFINGPDNVQIFEQLIKNLVKSSIISASQQQSLMNTISTNSEWINMNYDEILRWFS